MRTLLYTVEKLEVKLCACTCTAHVHVEHMHMYMYMCMYVPCVQVLDGRWSRTYTLQLATRRHSPPMCNEGRED